MKGFKAVDWTVVREWALAIALLILSVVYIVGAFLLFLAQAFALSFIVFICGLVAGALGTQTVWSIVRGKQKITYIP